MATTVSKLDLLFTLQGKDMIKVYTLNMENICRILRKHDDFKDRFRYDIFKNKIEMKTLDEWCPMEDKDALNIQSEISVAFSYFQKVNKQMVFDAITLVAYENKIDSAIEWIQSLTWDQTPRLDTWLCHAYGVTDNIYHKSVGSNWLKAIAKRIMVPACKFDHVLVLEGPQGAMKSESFNELVGLDQHIETVMGTESKDFYMQFMGKLVVEFSEGETLSRTEVKKMKGIITTRVDTFRPPYERTTKDFPRRCVFAMTTNQDQYLKDETGNRRWLPVKVILEQANVQWIKENKDQLFAEAYHKVITKHETFWEFPKAETEFEQSNRRIDDPNADLIVDWYYNLGAQRKCDGITIHEVYRDVFGMGFSSKPLTKYEEMAVAGVLKDVLKLTKRRMTDKGAKSTKWFDDKDFFVMGEMQKQIESTSVEDMDF